MPSKNRKNRKSKRKPRKKLKYELRTQCSPERITPYLRRKLQSMLHKSEKNKGKWNFIFNTILVFTCVRRAYLNLAPIQTNNLKLIEMLNATGIVPPLKLKRINPSETLLYSDPSIDEIKEWSDKQIGQVLGFYCAGNMMEYANPRLHRLQLNLLVFRNKFEIRPYAEACVMNTQNPNQRDELTDFLFHRANDYNRIAFLFGYFTTYKITYVPPNY